MSNADPGNVWEAFLVEIEPHVSPEWSRNARAHGDQPWIRLIALVDVHHQLTSPQIVEKIAMTMADLAGDRQAEVAGWTMLMERARDTRRELLQKVEDVAPRVLPDDLAPMFARSLTPVASH